MGLRVLSSVNPLSTNQLSCISMNNEECKVRPEIINVNSDEPAFYPFTIKKVNVAVLVTTPMIHVQNCVSLML